MIKEYVGIGLVLLLAFSLFYGMWKLIPQEHQDSYDGNDQSPNFVGPPKPTIENGGLKVIESSGGGAR